MIHIAGEIRKGVLEGAAFERGLEVQRPAGKDYGTGQGTAGAVAWGWSREPGRLRDVQSHSQGLACSPALSRPPGLVLLRPGSRTRCSSEGAEQGWDPAPAPLTTT